MRPLHQYHEETYPLSPHLGGAVGYACNTITSLASRAAEGSSPDAYATAHAAAHSLIPHGYSLLVALLGNSPST